MLYGAIILLVTACTHYTVIIGDFVQCSADYYYDNIESKCIKCDQTQFSEDGATSCSDCASLDGNPKLCLCDTTEPTLYNPHYASDHVCNQSGMWKCSEECFKQASIDLDKNASDFEFVPCNCSNAAPINKTKCETIKEFTNNCFTNENCEAYYSNYTSYCSPYTKSCSEKCYKAIENNTQLHHCHCYKLENRKKCDKIGEFFRQCVKNPPILPPKFNKKYIIVIIVVGIFVLFLVVVVLPASLRLFSLKVGHQLKKEGDLGKIIDYIVFEDIQLLSSENHHGYSEQVLKFPFVRLRFPGYRYFKRQHIVIKVFEQGRLKMFKQEYDFMHRLKEAKANNIITSYGTDMVLVNERIQHIQESFASFIEEVRTKCKKDPFRASMEYPCTYILLNHCNSQSLEKFTLTSARQIKQLAYNIANALSYLKLQCVVHNDLKPQNIFVKTKDKERNVSFVLGDFGMAQTYKPEFNEEYSRLGGTLYYNPPEYLHDIPNTDYPRTTEYLLKKSPRDPYKIDVYQYGLILWACLFQAEPGGSDKMNKQFPYKSHLHNLEDNINKAPTKYDDEHIVRLRSFRDADKHLYAKYCFRTLFKLDSNCRPTFDVFKSNIIKRNTELFSRLKNYINLCWNTNLSGRLYADQLRYQLDTVVYPAEEKLVMNYVRTGVPRDAEVYCNI